MKRRAVTSAAVLHFYRFFISFADGSHQSTSYLRQGSRESEKMKITDQIHALKIPFQIRDPSGVMVPWFVYGYMIYMAKM
jgi:hypothetical protein